MAGQLGAGGFESRTNPAERRDFFDLRRQITEINANIAALQTLTTPSTWTAVTFQNSWANSGGTAQDMEYRKIGDIVYLRGTILNGTINTTAFALPSGFRPPADAVLTTSGYNGVANAVCRVAIDTSGNVVVLTSFNNEVNINGSFSVTA